LDPKKMEKMKSLNIFWWDIRRRLSGFSKIPVPGFGFSKIHGSEFGDSEYGFGTLAGTIPYLPHVFTDFGPI
jgi:hypothetical protein